MTAAADIDTKSIERLEAAAPVGEPPPGARVLIRVRGVNKSFGPRHILRGIDLDIYQGETLVILGGSGSGKTTVVKHLMGSLKPDQGTIMVEDLDLVHAT
jgi:phospholipid/cholesterol/gamma-HCH transport system ATP-binding protein